MSALVPDGYFGVWDLPFPLLEAINQSMYFLRFDEMPHPEDKPPKKIWFDTDAMSAWFSMIDERMKRRSKGEEVGGEEDMEENATDLLV